MKTGKGIPDATFKGGFNWKVPGTFRESQGVWELGINPKTKLKKGMWNYGSKTYENFDYRG